MSASFMGMEDGESLCKYKLHCKEFDHDQIFPNSTCVGIIQAIDKRLVLPAERL